MNKLLKIGAVSLLSLFLFMGLQKGGSEDNTSILGVSKIQAVEKPSISYSTHVQSFGWTNPVVNGEKSGTIGLAKRMEGIKVSIHNTGLAGTVEYRTHVQKYGWMDWKNGGSISGTIGESKRLEAIELRLTGDLAKHYDIYYRVHAQKFGWLDWTKNGASSGTAGFAYRLEAIEIQLVGKNEKGPGLGGENAFKVFEKNPSVIYQTHVQSIGWQGFKKDGQMSGTQGLAKRLEGIKINLSNLPYQGGIKYRTHVQKNGWMSWQENNKMSGTTGEAKRLEAIEIVLIGEISKHYDVYYRVHAESFGWMDWAKNGSSAGTAGYGKRLEGIEVRLVKKSHAAPGRTTAPFRNKNEIINKKIVKVKEKEVVFKKQQVKTADLYVGENKVSQKGSNGFDTVEYQITYTNGKETSRRELSRVTTKPIDEITQVGARIKIKTITIVQPDGTIKVGDMKPLLVSVSPQDATDKQLIWTSTNNDIAYVDQQNNLIAKNIGTVTITATSLDGLISDSLSIVVNPVAVEKITLNESMVTLIEEQNYTLSATVSPENATDKKLSWDSSDENIVTVDGNGNIFALKAGTAIVSVSDATGNIVSNVNIIVEEPTIVFIGEVIAHVYQYDGYVLPSTVQAEMNNGTLRDVPIVWNDSIVDTSEIKTVQYQGRVDGYKEIVTLSLKVDKYNPNLQTNAYSAVTINNLSKMLSLSMTNNGEKPVTINKIEVYESGSLSSTYTTAQLENSGIPTLVLPNDSWGMSISYKLGIWVDGSYVKFYISANNTEYEYEHSLEKSW